MTRLLVVRADSAESADSPEFRYLVSWCLLQARDVFDEVTVSDGPAPGDARRFDAVLVLGSPNVLLGRRSLASLWDALRTGCAEARPYRLADLGARAPVYTLRGYERVEAAILAHGPALGAAVPASRLPVALLTPARFEDPASGGELAAAGICHEFIDYYGEVRSDVIPLLPHGARDVLEIGCGRGVTRIEG